MMCKFSDPHALEVEYTYQCLHINVRAKKITNLDVLFPIPSPLTFPNPIVVPYENSILFIGGDGNTGDDPQILQYQVGASPNCSMDQWVTIEEKLPFPVAKGKSIVYHP